MVTLFQFPPAIGLHNPSPFCLKLETWLRMADVEYKVKHLADPRKGPKGKLPFIQDGSVQVGDSHCIIDYLSEQRQIDLDAHLTPQQKAIMHALVVMLEEHYYWALLYNRWVGENWPTMRDELMKLMPPIIRNVIPGFIHKQQKAAIQAHGLGRHEPAEIYRMANEDMQAVAEILGGQEYLTGTRPCQADAVLYGFIANVLDSSLESPLKDFIRSKPNLTAYNARMRDRYFAK